MFAQTGYAAALGHDISEISATLPAGGGDVHRRSPACAKRVPPCVEPACRSWRFGASRPMPSTMTAGASIEQGAPDDGGAPRRQGYTPYRLLRA